MAMWNDARIDGLAERLKTAEDWLQRIQVALTADDGNSFGGRLAGLERDVAGLISRQSAHISEGTWQLARILAQARDSQDGLSLTPHGVKLLADLIEGEWGPRT